MSADREARNHEVFVRRLNASQSTKWMMARWLNERGYSVRVAPNKTARTASESGECVDDGDLEICQRIEVKKLTVDFTGRSDWPFRNNFIVCEKKAFDRAFPKPYAFIIVSASEMHAATVMGDTFKQWSVKRLPDRNYEGVMQDFYVTDTSRASFFRLNMATPVPINGDKNA